MIYKCEKCHYLFLLSKKLTDEQNNRYRCPDCGKFAVRTATVKEQKEYDIQLKTEDAWLDAESFLRRNTKG